LEILQGRETETVNCMDEFLQWWDFFTHHIVPRLELEARGRGYADLQEYMHAQGIDWWPDGVG
jgi:hypothetical protein